MIIYLFFRSRSPLGLFGWYFNAPAVLMRRRKLPFPKDIDFPEQSFVLNLLVIKAVLDLISLLAE